jgi:hypothetical protein
MIPMSRTPLKRTLVLTACLVLARVNAHGATPLAPGYAWAENLGWTRIVVGGETPPAAERDFLSGLLWGEGFGWIHLGDGSPMTTA